MEKKKYNSGELCLLWLDSFLGLEYKHKQELYKLIKGKTEIKNVLSEGRPYIENAIGAERYSLLLSSANSTYLNYIIDGLERKGIVAVTVESDGYPELLLNTSLPPLVLYAKGDTELLCDECFAVVGSRKSLPLSVKITENYVKSLIDCGFVPVTGIAEGADKAVIDTALKVNGKVISVLAGGFDCIYPKSHENLIDRIVEKGLVVSEYPPEVAAKPYHFPVRNRIIAGLSKGTLIVSAGKKSGALYTAEYAEEYGRDLFAVPYGIGVSSGAGCNDLIKRGAMLTDSPEDILEHYGVIREKSVTETLTEAEREIIEILKDGGEHIEKIAAATGKQPFEIIPVLSIMEIKGLVVKTGVNIYGLTRNYMEE